MTKEHAPWRKKRSWEAGVEEFWRVGTALPSMPKTLKRLLELPEWRGSAVSFEEKATWGPIGTAKTFSRSKRRTIEAVILGPATEAAGWIIVLRHPSGAQARIQASVFSDVEQCRRSGP